MTFQLGKQEGENAAGNAGNKVHLVENIYRETERGRARNENGKECGCDMEIQAELVHDFRERVELTDALGHLQP